MENQYLKPKKSTKLCLLIGTFTILFLLLLTFGSTNSFPLTSAQVQEWPQISFDRFFSVQYPPGWNADASRGVTLTAPDGFAINIGVDIPSGSDDSYPYPNTPMNSIAQAQIQLLAQNGFTYITSNTMGNPANPLIKNLYQKDNAYYIEYLAKRSSGVMTRFFIGGTLDQISSYGPLTTQILQNVQFNPAWEAEVRGMLDSIQQSILDTYGIAVESFGGMATDFAASAQQLSDYNAQKTCEARGYRGTTVCP